MPKMSRNKKPKPDLMYPASSTRLVSEDIRFCKMEHKSGKWTMTVSLKAKVRTPTGEEVIFLGNHEFPGYNPGDIIEADQ